MKDMYLNGFQIHSNSVDVGLVLYNNHQGFEGPDIALPTTDNPGDHGVIVNNQLYRARHLILPGRIAARDILTYQTLRRQLMTAIRIIKDTNKVSQPVTLSFTTPAPDNLALQASVYLEKTLQLPTRSLENANYMLSFLAPDPNLYSQALKSYTILLPSATGIVYPVIYPVIYPAVTGGSLVANNAGDMDTPVLLTFNGPLTSPFIVNLTTGESFQVDYTIPSGSQIVVDTGTVLPWLKTMTLNGTSSALQYFDANNVWMRLVPGNNNLRIGTALSSDTGNIKLQFRDAYYGV